MSVARELGYIDHAICLFLCAVLGDDANIIYTYNYDYSLFQLFLLDDELSVTITSVSHDLL